MRQIILDTETTGLDPNQGHRIIEIAAVEMVNRRLTGMNLHRYVQPDREIDPGAMQVHGISNEFLRDKPKFAQIADELLGFLEGAELIIHNAAFEKLGLNFVYLAFKVEDLPGAVKGLRALGNLRGPVILANDLMQGEMERAGRTASRFAINSTLGVGGIFDVANDRFGIRGHSEDFGQTLAVWGMAEGHYLFVPVFGPTNSRDLLGAGVDFLLSPWFWVGQGPTVEALGYTRAGMTVLDGREAVIDVLDDVRRTSLDPLHDHPHRLPHAPRGGIGHRVRPSHQVDGGGGTARQPGLRGAGRARQGRLRLRIGTGAAAPGVSGTTAQVDQEIGMNDARWARGRR